jgi:hypothetical protein
VIWIATCRGSYQDPQPSSYVVGGAVFGIASEDYLRAQHLAGVHLVGGVFGVVEADVFGGEFSSDSRPCRYSEIRVGKSRAGTPPP